MLRDKDLQRCAAFLDIARLLEQGKSFRQIADELEVSPAWITKLIARLEQRYRVTLASRDASGGASRLTDQGSELRRRIERLVDWRPGNDTTELTVAIPQALMNSQVVTSGINEFIEGHQNINLTLDVRSIPELGQLEGEVKARLIDIGIGWNMPERPGYVRDQRHSIWLPTVLLSHSDRLLWEMPAELLENIDLDTDQKIGIVQRFLSGKRVVVMNRTNQPFAEALESNERMFRLNVDDLDDAISAIASRVADYAIIPEIRSHLLQHQHTGRICWSAPIGKIGVMSITRGESSLTVEGQELLDRLRDMLRTESKFASEAEFGWADFPTDPGEYERFKYGYYIDIDRQKKGGGTEYEPVSYHSTRWKWEDLSIKRSDRYRSLGSVNECFFDCELVNMYKDKFAFEAAALLRPDGRLVALASSFGSDDGLTASVSSFVTVLTRCIQLDDTRILGGVWIGLDLDKRPSTYAAIWSEKKLSAATLTKVSSRFWSRTVLAAECVPNFDSHLDD
jgi:DNA-binding transcriptional LysR family regulator